MTARLSAVPDSPPRAVGYIRVSTARDDMVSPELQLTAIQEHCQRAGYVLIEVIEDLDLTGRFWRRRQAERAVTMVERGDADVIVLWKWSRLTRNRRDWAVAVDRVEVAGGKLESATEPVDTSTSSGRLARGMLAELAAFESERIGDVWREVHARRTKRGLPANGKPRFGYRHVDGLHRPDPDTGPVLAALYRRYVAGETIWSLTAWLNREGVLTVPGYSAKGPGPWSMNGLRNMLDTGFGAGFITVHGSRERGVHEPVVDEATWTAYLAARAGRRPLRRADRSLYLLSGLVWCRCGSKMGAGHYGRTNSARLRCLRSTQPGAERHPGSYPQLAPVDAAVRAWIEQLADQVDTATDRGLAQAARATRRRHDAAALARELVAVDRAIGRLTADHVKGTIPDVAYRPALDELTRERGQLEQRRVAAAADAAAGEPARIAADLAARWDVYDVAQRRATLRHLIARVVVDGRPRAAPEVLVVPKPGG